MKSMWKAVEDWRVYRRNVQELERYSDRELNDLGIARADIPAIVRGKR